MFSFMLQPLHNPAPLREGRGYRRPLHTGLMRKYSTGDLRVPHQTPCLGVHGGRFHLQLAIAIGRAVGVRLRCTPYHLRHEPLLLCCELALFRWFLVASDNPQIWSFLLHTLHLLFAGQLLRAYRRLIHWAMRGVHKLAKEVLALYEPL